MPYLVAAVALTGALGLLNLILLLAVIRRLREMTSRDAQTRRPREEMLRPVGSQLEAFTVTDVDGVRLTSAAAADRLLVGFFAPGCTPCHEQIPAFRRLAAAGGRDSALAVVVGTPGEKADAVAGELSPAARVVIEGMGGSLTTTFGVSGFPTFYVIDADRRVRSAELNIARIDAALPAPVTGSA